MSIRLAITISSFIAIVISEWAFDFLGVSNFGVRHLILAATAVVLLFLGGRKSSLPISYYVSFCLIILIGVIGTVGQETPLLNRLLGVGFTIFPFVLFVLASSVRYRESDLIAFLRFLVVFCIITGLYPVFRHLPNLPEAMRFEFGVFVGVYRELAAYAGVMNIGVAAALTMAYRSKSKLYFWAAILLSIFVFITILKKTIISNLIVWICYLAFNPVKTFRKEIALALVLIAPLMVASFSGAVSSNLAENASYLEISGTNEHVRIGMYLVSFYIASDHFPVGSGFGSFGSVASIFRWYSPIYYKYSVDIIGSNSEELVIRGEHTILDTFWPHIFGELGVFGSLFYVLVAFYPIFAGVKFLMSHSYCTFRRQVAIFLISVNVAVAWEGLTLYNPETPLFMFFTGLVSGISYRLLRERSCALR